MSWYRSQAARQGISIPARKTAKWKTFIQDWAIAVVSAPADEEPRVASSWLLIWLAAAATVWTGFEYWRDGRRLGAEARP